VEERLQLIRKACSLDIVFTLTLHNDNGTMRDLKGSWEAIEKQLLELSARYI
jgi:hypothetical protein